MTVFRGAKKQGNGIPIIIGQFCEIAKYLARKGSIYGKMNQENYLTGHCSWQREVFILSIVGLGCMILAAFFFGSLGPAERIAFEHGVTPAGVSVVRAVAGAFVVTLDRKSVV